MQDLSTTRPEFKGLFVTGTDTEVGKTFASAALVAKLGASYWKPIQTGPYKDHDTPEIKRLTGIDDGKFYPCSYSFPDPFSPHEAGKRVNKEIDLESICPPKIGPEELLVVEGAGGALVPLNKHYLMTDLMVQLGLPIVVVSRSGLGTINHTLLTLETLRRRGLSVAGVIVNGPENKPNCEAIEEYGKVKVLAELPWCEDVSPEAIEKLMPQLDRAAEILGEILGK